jgi:Caspase domain
MTEISIKKAIPANVIILSGAQVDTSNKVKYNDSNEIPKITGKIGGKLTTAWIGVMSRYIKDGKLTWFEMLERTKQTLESDGFHDQSPQLLSSHKFNVQNPLRLFPSSSKSTIRVLLIGMQYSQQSKEHQIFHAHGQVEDTRQYLSKYHDVSFKRMDILTDQKDQVQPTRKNILVGMQKLSRATKPGDSALVLICGHAGRIQTKRSGEQETLLPIDFKSEGPITQEDIYKHLICSMPAKSNLVCIFDLIE